MNKHILILCLMSVKGIGNKRIYDICKKYNFSYEDIKLSLKEELNDKEKYWFKNNIETVEKQYIQNINHNINVISILDDDFPKSLYKTKNPCILLYYVGNISLLKTKCVSVIGTRKPTDAFIEKGKEAVKRLTEANYTIVSGLALGCDTIAHTECLENKGKTIAILPSSLDNIMPPSNKELANRIVENEGLLISEYPYNTPYNKYAYAVRDRLQAYLSDSILVIESTDKGGTMIAVERALEEKKKVFSINGNTLSLIKDYVDPLSHNFLDNFIISETKKEEPEQLSLF